MNRCPDSTEDRVREALLYECLGDKVRCHTCERRCHRRFIALELEKQGWQVKHIIDRGRDWLPRKHQNPMAPTAIETGSPYSH